MVRTRNAPNQEPEAINNISENPGIMEVLLQTV